MTNNEHIQLLDETLLLATDMLHDLEPNGVNRIRVMSLLNSAMFINDSPKDGRRKKLELLKGKLERYRNDYEIKKK